MFYFSYSYFMNHHAFFAVCPGARFIGPAELSGYMLMFDGYSPSRKGAIANIESSPDDEVWGGLYEIRDEHLPFLDQHFNYPRYSERRLMKVRDREHDQRIEAWVYYHEPLAEGIPSHEYIRGILKGARECRVPEGYIDDWIGPFLRISGQAPAAGPDEKDAGFRKYEN